MAITITDINGVNHTVVWHDGTAGKWNGDYRRLHDGKWLLWHSFNRNHHTATALPPLPRHLTAKDAPLLHAYAAQGLVPVLTLAAHYMRPTCLFIGELAGGVVVSAPDCDKESYPLFVAWEAVEIAHAMYNGERVEIAIRGGV
jgi:hypothetical protein